MTRRSILPILPLACLLIPVPVASAEEGPPPGPARFAFLGEAVIPPEPPAAIGASEAPVGGLSALAYDPGTGTYLAVSDDGASRGPARFYQLEIELHDGVLERDGARVVGVTELLDSDGESFARATVDPEGLVPAAGPGEGDGQGGLYVSSEGRTDHGVPPFVRLYSRDGRVLAELTVPDHFLPGEVAGGGRRGVRHNFGFESLSLSPGGRFLFSAGENALAQDGPAASPASGSPARLLRWELAADGAAAGPPEEWVYPVDPVALAPRQPGALTVAGLVELLALGPETLLALERSYTEGVGTAVKLYRVSLAEATPVTGRASLDLHQPGSSDVEPAAKTLLLDLTEVLTHLGIPVDNLEGLTFGPDLPDGRRTLLLVSDDNFSGDQRTQVLALAVDDSPVPIAEIQGRGHRSPLEGEWVRGVRGVVSAVDPHPAAESGPEGELRRFWMEDPAGDDDPATSEGLRVRLRRGERAPLPGERVRVAGRVEERGFPGALPVTTLAEARVEGTVEGTGLGGAALRDPVILGRTGLPLPDRRIDDDGLERFQPLGDETDAVDLWESLEGMRVTVPEPVVVGPTTRHGGFVVLPDGGAGARLRSCAGGIVARPDDFNPERVPVTTALLDEAPALAVGDRLAAPVTGVVEYDFGNYRVLPWRPLPPAVRLPAADRRSPVPAAPLGSLTVATYNVLNLHPASEAERFRRLATHVVVDLGAPDIVALQEIQDASGPRDDSVVAGAPTFERLIRAIEEAGGPAYSFVQIDPVDGTEGGQPGGNIRVGYLLRPDRVEMAPAAAPPGGRQKVADSAEPGAPVRILSEGRSGEEAGSARPRLAPNPGRIAPHDPCFTGAGDEGHAPTRRSLALEVRFGPRTVFLVDNHWKSKRGDDRLFGAVQPPVLHTEGQRTCQARRVADFVRELLAADPDAWVIVLGDLNEHEFRPPLAALEEAGLVNLLHRIPRADRYTYNFEGNSQVLDHILVSPGILREAVVLPEIAHVNADRPADEAASDHDPVRVTIVPRGDPTGRGRRSCRGGRTPAAGETRGAGCGRRGGLDGSSPPPAPDFSSERRREGTSPSPTPPVERLRQPRTAGEEPGLFPEDLPHR